MNKISRNDKVFQVPYQKRPELKRNLKVFQMYTTGSYSYNTLGRIFKISPQRVRQIYKTIERELIVKHTSGKFSSIPLAKFYGIEPTKLEQIVKKTKKEGELI
jgi:hypothetical protein